MKIAVIKIGGALLQKENSISSFWRSVKRLMEDMKVVIVHGGGPQATKMARRLNHEPTIVEGRRVTSILDLNIMHWVLCGELNTILTAQALSARLPAVGISGIDGQIVKVEKRPPWTLDGKEIDFGHVGDIKQINTSFLDLLLENNLLPIITPLGIDEKFSTYNVNADTVAQHIAIALKAKAFLMITETGGVRSIPAQENSLLSVINEQQFDEGKEQGWIQGGMVVKLKVAFEAHRSGIPEVYITQPSDIYNRSAGTRVI